MPAAGWQPVREADATLVSQLTDDLARRIDDQGLRPGTRLPSIRKMAEQAGVSRFTVVEAYDRLVARGLLQSRRGAGFFVKARSRQALQPAPSGPQAPARIDHAWLLRSLFGTGSSGTPSSMGLLPTDWLDPDMVAAAVRAVGRSARTNLLAYGHPQGYEPLRQQIAALLQERGLVVHPERNLLTTNGVTHGLDLVVRHFVQPGDTVLVEDPGWFVIFGRLASMGARLIGVPRGPQGPDIAWLEKAATQHKPKLFIINSAVHNPTGHTLSAGAAYDVLRVAERHDFRVVEDVTYGELHPGRAITLGELDRFKRVIMVGGFSKMLAASLRVGYVAADPDIVQQLTDLKLLAGLTSGEVGERVVHRVLMEGQYRRHVERVRQRVDEARERCVKALLKLGFAMPHEPYAGIFILADCGRDSETVAREAAGRGMLLVPGTLFSPSQAPSTLLRFAVSMVDDGKAWRDLAVLQREHAGAAARS